MGKRSSATKTKDDKSVDQKTDIEENPAGNGNKSINSHENKRDQSYKIKDKIPAIHLSQMTIQAVVQIILLIGLVGGIIADELKIIHALILWVLGGGTLAFMIQLFYSINERQLPGIESFWGGMDGGMGGWELSKGATYFILVFVFGFLFFFSAASFLGKLEEKEKSNNLNLIEIQKLESANDSLQSLISKFKAGSEQNEEDHPETDTLSSQPE